MSEREHNIELDAISFNLLNKMSKLAEKQLSHLQLYDLVQEGLLPVKVFPGYLGHALYLLIQDTFEFELKVEEITDGKTKISGQFQNLINQGTIGQALQSGNLAYHSENGEVIYCLPMLSSDGVLGIILIKSTVEFGKIEYGFIRLLRVYSRLIAGYIENFRLYLYNRQNQDLLDQFVAKRTLKLIASQKELGDKLENMKANLLMSIPHEFRTPINQILGISNYLINYFTEFESEKADDISDFLNDIKFSAERLKNVFENYIYYANLTLISTNIEDLDLIKNQVCHYPDSIIYESSMFRANAYKRDNDLEINLVSKPVAMSEEHLTKITHEIADNCFKYSKEGKKVIVSSHLEKNKYVICFHDNGIGFEEEKFQKIDAYMQFDRLKNEQQGIGLGLSIVNKILDIYRGAIELESKEGEYTKLFVKIPLSLKASLDEI